LQAPGVELAQGDVTEEASLPSAAAGIHTAIHLVGIIRESKGRTFEDMHTRATQALIRACVQGGVRRFIYISAVGADENAASRYHHTKWQAEEAVKRSGLEYLILRPSIICGPGDGFVTMLVDMLKGGRVFPIIGSGEYQLQPVWVQDLHTCIIEALAEAPVWNRTYEIGGPEAMTFNQVVEQVMQVSGIRRRRVHLPLWLMSPAVAVLQRFPAFPLTSDQLLMMQQGNVCDIGPMRHDFGVEPAPFRQVIETYVPTLARDTL
jgi:NADH dehydrogenase